MAEKQKRTYTNWKRPENKKVLDAAVKAKLAGDALPIEAIGIPERTLKRAVEQAVKVQADQSNTDGGRALTKKPAASRSLLDEEQRRALVSIARLRARIERTRPRRKPRRLRVRPISCKSERSCCHH